MAEVNTDSYPKPPALPAQKSLLDTVGQFQNLESNNLTIGKQKLDLMNSHFQIMNAELANLADDPNATPQVAMDRLNKIADTLGTPPPVRQQMLSEYSGLTTPQQVNQAAKLSLMRGMAMQDKINKVYGANGFVNNGQSVIPTLTRTGEGPRSAGMPIQLQAPPTTAVRNEQGEPAILGPQPATAAPGAVAAPPGLPVSRPAITPPGPINNPAILGPSSNFGGTVTGAMAEPATFASRFGPATGFAPGVKEAADVAGQASGTQLAKARDRAASFQRDIFPLAQAIPALEKLGAKGTGPGTETINNIKSFVLSNVPGVKESDFGFGTVKDFDKARKYLTDFVNQTGNSGTNDKLAAAFAGNPSVKISNAAAVDVAKSAAALRRMEQSKYLAYEDSGLSADKASQFFANGVVNLGKDANGKARTINISQLDPRAFGVDDMSDKAKKVLLDELNKNPREKDLFDKSLEIAKHHGYLAIK